MQPAGNVDDALRSFTAHQHDSRLGPTTADAIWTSGLPADLLDVLSPVAVVSPEAWYQIGRQLGQRRQHVDRMGSRQMWAIGDWMLAGEQHVHRRLKRTKIRDLGMEATGYSRHTLTMATSVARKVKPAARVDGLSWWHHLAVSGLPEDEQSEWLARAAEAEWTARTLREELTAIGKIRSRSVGRAQRLVGEILKLRLSDLPESTRSELCAWWARENAASAS